MRRPTRPTRFTKLPWRGAALVCALLLCGAYAARAQTPDAPKAEEVQRGEINHEVQLHLLVASDAAGERERLPPALDDTVRQLRAALPYQHYRLVTTFFNRVRDNGNLDVSGVSNFPATPLAANANSPTFYNYSLNTVTLTRGSGEPPFIRVVRFRLGLKMPVQTGVARAEGGGSYPVINYQDTGLTTELSAREGVPTIVGTLAASQPNEIYVLVLTLRRTAAR
ncbi:MAG TPA: hypothetical protein VF546_01145 [Pyrinomonadaceae bacterium]|jgi:hypothetical protein